MIHYVSICVYCAIARLLRTFDTLSSSELAFHSILATCSHYHVLELVNKF